MSKTFKLITLYFYIDVNVLPFFSCKFDDELSQYFHRFLTVCICWDTPSENNGLLQLPNMSIAFKCEVNNTHDPGLTTKSSHYCFNKTLKGLCKKHTNATTRTRTCECLY